MNDIIETNILTSNDKPMMPNHVMELGSSDKTFKHLSKKFKDVQKAYNNGELTEDELILWNLSIKYQIEDILYQVGELSQCVRNLKESLREYFFNNFKPALAEAMFEKEYDEAELPYDVIKNKCFQLIGKIVNEEL